MSSILVPEQLFHTGFVVADLEASMARFSDVGGYEWSDVVVWNTPAYIAGELRMVELRYAFTKNAPHIELAQEVPGTFWAVEPGSGAHHVGYFVDDLAKASHEMQSLGFSFEGCGATEDGEQPNVFAFLTDGAGLRIELVDESRRGSWQERVGLSNPTPA